MPRREEAARAGSLRSFIAGLLALFCLLPPPLLAEEAGDDLALIRADRLTYDPTLDTVSAEGHVEIAYREQILRADRLTYNQGTDVVMAVGNVVLIDKDGNILFADFVELTDAMRDGVIEKIGMLLTDNSRVAANTAVRRDGRFTVLHKAVYSPCDLCAEDPERAPLWQLKARRVIHDQELKDITYHDASFELFGIPIAYMPLFSHPDPTVKRRSGFLTPGIGSSSELGTKISIPYYWEITNSIDATFTPTFTTKEGIVLRGEFRQRLRRGEYVLDASITRPDERDTNNLKTGSKDNRGHFFGEGRFDIGDVWRWGFNVQRVTDDTYLRRYDILNVDRLENRLFVEGIDGRNFVTANAYLFQDLRAGDVPGLTPSVAPEIEALYMVTPPYVGGRVAMSANLLSLTRSEGPNIHRLSTMADWRRRFVTAQGHVITGFASLRGDIYVTTDILPSPVPVGVDNSATVGRVLPRVGVEWRFPLARNAWGTTQVVEPIAQFIYAPEGGNPAEIPNEDSVSIDLDENNLFRANRFTGLDRWEDGPRMTYGLRAAVYWPDDRHIEAMIGQSYRFDDDSPFAASSGLDDQASDIVGYAVVAPTRFVTLSQRFRLDKDDLSLIRNESEVSLRYWRFQGSAAYTKIAGDGATASFSSREGMRAAAALAVTKYWTVRAATQRDITNHRGVYHEIGLRYVDECTEFGITFRRDFTEDRDIERSNAILVEFRLTNLG